MKSSLKHISSVSNNSLVEMIDGILIFFSKSYMINSVKICFRWKSWVLVEGCLKEDWGIRWRVLGKNIKEYIRTGALEGILVWGGKFDQ